MRFGTRAVASAGFVVALGANVAAAQGYGPFAENNGYADAITLQIFLAIALITSFVVAAMASDLADRDEVHRLLTCQATHDALTGLPNRVLFGQKLNHALQSCPQSGRTIAVLMIDLDEFKKINDRHGHPTGDQALGVIASRLRRNVRPGHFLARLGGDEFVAEGIETVQQLQHLIRLGCDQGHGFLFSASVDGVTAAELTRRTFAMPDPLELPASNMNVTVASFS